MFSYSGISCVSLTFSGKEEAFCRFPDSPLIPLLDISLTNILSTSSTTFYFSSSIILFVSIFDLFISTFNIPINDLNQPEQEVKTFWDLKSLGLMPEDEVHFHFELYDNDNITGPKKSISSTFIARLPSLNDLFHSFNEKESEIEDFVNLELKDIKKLQQQLEKTKLDILKVDELEWKNQKGLKSYMVSLIFVLREMLLHIL